MTEINGNGNGKSRDTRAALAIIAIVGAFLYQGLLLWSTHGSTSAEVQIPAWMSAIAMGVIGFYFGARAADKNGS